MRALARRHGISATTVQKWRKRDTTDDACMGLKQISSSALTVEQEAMIVASGGTRCCHWTTACMPCSPASPN